MTTPSEPRTPRSYHGARDLAFSPLEAVGVLSASLATSIVVGAISLQAGLPVIGAVIAGELILLAVPMVAAIVLGHRLGVNRMAWRFAAGAALIGISGWYLNLRLIELLPLPEGASEQLRGVVTRPALAVTLFAIAVCPAVCEEVLFRGVLFRALATRFVPWVACVVSAAVFAAYHLNLGQLAPTFLIGLVLGWLTYRARSIVPAMLAHLLNNVAGVLVSRDQPRGLTRVFTDHPAIALCAATLLTGGGILLLARSPSPPDATTS